MITYILTAWVAASVGFVLGAWWQSAGADEPTDTTKDEALRRSLWVLENLGKRRHGGSVNARAAHAIITKQLQQKGIDL